MLTIIALILAGAPGDKYVPTESEWLEFRWQTLHSCTALSGLADEKYGGCAELEISPNGIVRLSLVHGVKAEAVLVKALLQQEVYQLSWMIKRYRFTWAKLTTRTLTISERLREQKEAEK